MTTNIFKGIIIILISLYTACTMKYPPGSIELTSTNAISVHDLFSEVNVVKLDSHPDFLIDQISRIKYFESQYFILDIKSQQIFCFNNDGSFVFKLNSQGKGPGEYHDITDFSIDQSSKHIIVLDPLPQQIIIFDLAGNYLYTKSIASDKVLGYDKIFSLNDSVLLLTSISNNQFIFFDLKEGNLIFSDYWYDVSSTLQAFNTLSNVYQLEGRTYIMPALGQEIFDITEIKPVSHFKWCFGKNNNTEKQIRRLTNEINRRQGRDAFRYAHEAVGNGKILNHHFIRVFETSRFNISILEFNYNYLHVVIDKRAKQAYTFNNFKEGISLISTHIQNDRVITHENGAQAIIQKSQVPELINRKIYSFKRDIFSEEDRQIIDSHDPMKENPFLVEYIFKK